MRVHAALENFAQAEVWARHAEAASATLDDPGGLDEAEGHHLMAGIHYGLGDLEAARTEGELAYAQRAATLGADHPITAAVVRELGRYDLAAGRPRAALERFDTAASIWLRAVGPEHPRVGKMLQLQAEATLALERVDDAAGLAQSGLAVLEGALAGDHPDIAFALDTLGKVDMARGRLEAAQTSFARALAIRRETLGHNHRDVAASMVHLADLDRARGLGTRAAARCSEALRILGLAVADGHPRLKQARAACGRVSDARQALASPG